MGESTMNEEFLFKFQKPPRPEFARSLYEKLMQEPKSISVYQRYFTIKRMALVMAVLGLVFVLSLTFSPATRAAARALIDHIIGRVTVGGTTVLVSEDPPVPIAEGQSESYSEI